MHCCPETKSKVRPKKIRPGRIRYTVHVSIQAYGKAENGNEMETGNENWKWKLEMEMEMEMGTKNTPIIGVIFPSWCA